MRAVAKSANESFHEETINFNYCHKIGKENSKQENNLVDKKHPSCNLPGQTPDKKPRKENDANQPEVEEQEYLKALFIEEGLGSQKVCIKSPDNQYILEISILKVDKVENRVFVNLRIVPNSETEEQIRENPEKFLELNPVVAITPFDFPFTDNTRLDLNNRFALILEKLPEEETEETLLSMKIVWFPKDYITVRDRPINYSEIRSLLNLGRRKGMLNVFKEL